MFMPLMTFWWPLVHQTYTGQSVLSIGQSRDKGLVPIPPVSSSSSISVLESLLGWSCCFQAQVMGEVWNVGIRVDDQAVLCSSWNKESSTQHLLNSVPFKGPITSLNIPFTIRYVSLINKWQVVKVTDTSYSVHHLMLPVERVEWLRYTQLPDK